MRQAITLVAGRTQLSAGGGFNDLIVSTATDPAYNSATQADDAGLLLLADPVPAANATTIKLAGPDETSLWRAGKVAAITGWGRTSEGGAKSDVLKFAQVPIVSDSICSGIYGSGFFASVMVCAGYPQGGVDACQGDSGGPLAVPAHGGDGGLIRQAGVTSFGAGCARPGLPGVYSRVGSDPLRSFIQGTVDAGPDPGSVVGSGRQLPLRQPQGPQAEALFLQAEEEQGRA